MLLLVLSLTNAHETRENMSLTMEEHLRPDETAVPSSREQQPPGDPQETPAPVVAHHQQGQQDGGGRLHTCSQQGGGGVGDPQVEVASNSQEERKQRDKQNTELR